MTWINIVEIVVVIICAVTYGMMLYFKVKGNLAEGVSELIALAEKTNLSGSKKMEQVVNAMYDKVPSWLKKILGKYELEKIAQWVFDWMRKYAEAYQNATETEGGNKEAAKNTADIETITALISELANKSLEELIKKATEYGLEINTSGTKEEIIKEIVTAVMNKV